MTTIKGTSIAPDTQASNLAVTGFTETSFDLSWTRGNGANVLVVVSILPVTSPTNGNSYSANAAYASGAAVGAGYAVYSGTGTSVTVTGLSAGETYFIKAFEFNGTAYNVSNATDNPIIGFSMTAEYDNVIDVGGTLPTFDEQYIANAFVKWCKKIHAWQKHDEIYLFIQTGDSTFACIGLKVPGTNVATPVSGPAFGSTGFTGDASADYLDLNLTPSTLSQFITNYASIWAYTPTNNNSNTFLFGATSNSALRRINFIPRNTSDEMRYRLNNTNQMTITGITDSSGTWKISRKGSIMEAWRNNRKIHEIATEASVDRPTIDLYALGENNNGSLAAPTNRTISAIGVGGRNMYPMTLPVQALVDNDLDFYHDFFRKMLDVKTFSGLTKITGTTGQSWNGLDLLDRGDGKYDWIGQEETGNVVYATQGASIASWTLTTLFDLNVECQSLKIWGRVSGRLVIITAEADTGNIRVHLADNTNDKGTYTSGIIATLPYAQNIIIRDMDGDAENEFMVSWQGANATEGGITAFDWDGGTITDAASWDDYLIVDSSQAWWSKMMPDGRILFSGRNFFGRFIGGSPGVYYATEDTGPFDPWIRTTVDNATDSNTVGNRVPDFLHVDHGDFFGNGNDDIVACNYDNGLVFIYDEANSYAKTTIDLGVSIQASNIKAMNFQVNGRDAILVFFEDCFTFLIYWSGSEWFSQRLFETTRHPADNEIIIADIDDDGVDEILFDDSSQVLSNGDPNGYIGWFRLTN